MLPEFGVGLRQLLFGQNQKEVEEKIRTRVYDQVDRYLPVVDIIDVLIERNQGNIESMEDPYTIRVKILYDIPELMDEDSLEFKF
jgi:phage baseplate assembly protein W